MTRYEIDKQIEAIGFEINRKSLASQARTEQLLEKAYEKESNKIVKIILAGDIGFESLKTINDMLDSVKTTLDAKTQAAIIREIERQIKFGVSSVKKQINIFKSILPSYVIESDLSIEVIKRIALETAEAMKKLVDGLSLSDKIWNITQTSLTQMRAYMLQSMINGVDFSTIYQQIKSFLILPDVDLRTKKWKEFFKNNPPGKGVYRSAWKNVMRLIRSETNRSFREVFKQYAKDKQWINGIKWNLSDAHPEFDICDFYANDDTGLGPGVYTSVSVPDSHPHCICYLTFVPNYEFIGVQL